MTDARTLALIEDLRALPAETAWIEFKENDAEPRTIGTLISALSNSARLADRNFAYVVWGIRDGDHAAVGTTFDPSQQKERRLPLESWLAQRLRPRLPFIFQTVDHRSGRLVLLEIPAATASPVEFDRTAYIRVGGTTLRLADHPERQQALWSKVLPYAWENGVAAQSVTGGDVLRLLDYSCYFDLTGQPLPENRHGILHSLRYDRLITPDAGKLWNITNLGGILFARRLSDFGPRIARKEVRFVSYDGGSRAATVIRRKDEKRGYANGFGSLMDYVDGLLPRFERIGRAFREEIPKFPPVAVRELIANALIHQDMTITGAGTLIELFEDRIEITNPGVPLVCPERIIDSPPRSRNDALASLMRRMRLCEERGTGIDKVIAAVENLRHPPPDFRVGGESMRVVLYAQRRFADLTTEERMRACYQHAVLKYVGGERLRNSTLCERFGIDNRNAAQVSRVIGATLEAGLIRQADPDRPRSGYVPKWARRSL